MAEIACQSFSKTNLIQSLISELEREKQTLERAAAEARDTATHAENKPENKYDTRGLEASYLAHGQSKRAEDLALQLREIHQLVLKKYSTDQAIGPTAVVKVQIGQACRTLFLLPLAGGATLLEQDVSVQVLSTQAPLAMELLGRFVGDEFVFQNKDYVILDVG